MKIVVIGGSGLIGAKLVANLQQKGHEVLAASPLVGVNTLTGEGPGRGAGRRPGGRRRRELAVVRGPGGAGVLRNRRPQSARGRSGRWRQPSRRSLGRRHRPHARQRLLPRQAGPGEADQGRRRFLTRSSAPRSSSSSSAPSPNRAPTGKPFDYRPPMMQPIAADDVAAIMAESALASRSTARSTSPAPNLSAWRISSARFLALIIATTREVIADPDARYFGARVDDKSLTPGAGPRLRNNSFR